MVKNGVVVYNIYLILFLCPHQLFSVYMACTSQEPRTERDFDLYREPQPKVTAINRRRIIYKKCLKLTDRYF